MSVARILLVEDDHDLAENLSEILVDLGYEVELAPSAERALDLVRFRDVRVGKLGQGEAGLHGPTADA